MPEKVFIVMNIGDDCYYLFNPTLEYKLKLPGSLTASINEVLKDVPTFMYDLEKR